MPTAKGTGTARLLKSTATGLPGGGAAPAAAATHTASRVSSKQTKTFLIWKIKNGTVYDSFSLITSEVEHLSKHFWTTFYLVFTNVLTLGAKHQPESRCWRDAAFCLRKSSLKLSRSLSKNIFCISWDRTLLTMSGRLLWLDTIKIKYLEFLKLQVCPLKEIN